MSVLLFQKHKRHYIILIDIDQKNEDSMFNESILIMAVGMGSVFVFLGILVVALQISARFLLIGRWMKSHNHFQRKQRKT